MEKTVNYQLNQWDAADPIRREDFNADNARLDTAILEVKNQVETVAAANYLVKLTEVTTAETVSQIDLDLSGFDMSRFQALELYVEGAAASQSDVLYCIVNGDSSAVYLNGTSTTATTHVQLGSTPYSFYGVGGCDCRIFSNGQHLCFISTDYHANSSGGANYSLNYSLYKTHTVSDITSLTLSTCTYPFLAGLKVILYGTLK